MIERLIERGQSRVRLTTAYDGLQDTQLIGLVAERDGGALEALYQRYIRSTYSLARRILSDDSLAQEVVQEVFLSLWRDASRFDADRGSLATYLLSVTHHRAVDAVRKEENVRKRRASDELLQFEADPVQNVEDSALRSDRGARVRAALAQLPPIHREALALAYFGGYTQREVAVVAGIPLGTVKTRMAAGMRKLKQALDEGEEPE